MTDKKISELSSNGTLTGSELLPLVQSGGNAKALLSEVKTFIIDGLLSAATAATSETNASNSAAASATSASNALTSENNAALSETNSANSAAAAEESKNISYATNRIYVDTTAGLAATTTGQYFYVLNTTTYLIYDLYLNNAGSAVYKKSINSSALLDVTTRSTRSGVAGGFFNAATKRGAFLEKNGFWKAKLKLTSGTGTTVSYDTNYTYSINTPLNTSQLLSGYSFIFKGLNAKGYGFKRNGELVAKMPREVEAGFTSNGTISAWIARDSTNTASIYIKKSTDTVIKLSGVTKPSSPFITNSNIVFYGQRNGEYGYYYVPEAGTPIYKVNPYAAIVCYGDSLTAGSGATNANTTSYPPVLGGLLGMPVFNKGLGGTVSAQIIYRQGGFTATATLASNQIPASGAVTVTNWLINSSPSTSSANPFTPNTTGSMLVSISGIVGTLSLASGVLSFTRRDTGSITVVSNPVQIIPYNPYENEWIHGLWIGQNDAGNSAIMLAGYAAALTKINTLNKRFYIVSYTGSAVDIIGSANHNIQIATNAALLAAYPNNFVDVRTALINAYNPAIPQDVTDYANNVIPSSLRSDSIHLNDAGYAIVASTINTFLINKGWI